MPVGYSSRGGMNAAHPGVVDEHGTAVGDVVGELAEQLLGLGEADGAVGVERIPRSPDADLRVGAEAPRGQRCVERRRD